MLRYRFVLVIPRILKTQGVIFGAGMTSTKPRRGGLKPPTFY
jgi:hypothetical protein